MENKKRTHLEECVIYYKGNYYLKTDVGYKKIILTTDQDLIANGVQKVPEDFLLWFVKNPNCESVEIEELGPGFPAGIYFINYLPEHFEKPIIPQEEPKQEILQDEIYQAIGLSANKEGIINQALATAKVMGTLKNHISNKEAIEETAKKLFPVILEDGNWDKNKQYRDEWIEGAMWQAERMYSEKDLMEAFDAGYDLNTWEQLEIPNDERDYLDFKEWFDQFKKHNHEE